MTQHNTLNVKLSNSKFDKLQSGIKNSIDPTLKMSSNFAGDSNDADNFPQKLLLTNKLCKAFKNNSSANIKLSKTQLHNCTVASERTCTETIN